MLPEATGNIPDLAQRGPEYYQDLLVRFRTLVKFRTSSEVREITMAGYRTIELLAIDYGLISTHLHDDVPGHV